MPRRFATAALLALTLLPGAASAEKRSGYDDASPPVRAMQDDDAGNPGSSGCAKAKRCGPNVRA